MTLTTLSDDDADIKIEYVKPKDEQILGTINNHTISRAEIITESELPAGTNFKTNIDIDEDTKQHSVITNNNHKLRETSTATCDRQQIPVLHVYIRLQEIGQSEIPFQQAQWNEGF